MSKTFSIHVDMKVLTLSPIPALKIFTPDVSSSVVRDFSERIHKICSGIKSNFLNSQRIFVIKF